MRRPRYQVTDAFIAAVRAERAAGEQQQELCRLVGLHPVTLSRWLHRSRDQWPRPDDPRLRRLAHVLGVPVEACVEVARQSGVTRERDGSG
jgi:transcriptional regulator with XRE-family HTH domain